MDLSPSSQHTSVSPCCSLLLCSLSQGGTSRVELGPKPTHLQQALASCTGATLTGTRAVCWGSTYHLQKTNGFICEISARVVHAFCNSRVLSSSLLSRYAFMMDENKVQIVLYQNTMQSTKQTTKQNTKSRLKCNKCTQMYSSPSFKHVPSV